MIGVRFLRHMNILVRSDLERDFVVRNKMLRQGPRYRIKQFAILIHQTSFERYNVDSYGASVAEFANN